MSVQAVQPAINTRTVLVARAALALAVSLACWAAALALWDRWWAPWGSQASAMVFAIGVLSWAWLAVRGREAWTPAHACAPAFLAASAACLLVYAALYTRLPQLVSCELALTALGCVLMGTLPAITRRQSWGVFFLIVLSAHVATSLEFFIGFPLRLVVGKIAALMLGQSIQAVGTGLTDGANTVFIDAPCSGVRMLSTSLVLASALAVLMRLRLYRTLLLLAIAVVLAVLGNAERAATLFIVTSAGDSDSDMDLVFGIIVFAGCVCALTYAASVLKRRENPAPQSPLKSRPERAGRPVLYSLFALACVAAVIRPVFAIAAEGAEVRTPTQWPTTWEGQRLIPVPVSEGMREYLRDFPGDSAQFQVGDTGKLILLRRTAFATRKLHSSENCYRGKGVTRKPMPAVRDTGGRLWSQFWLNRPFSAPRTVRQCYFSIDPAAAGGALEDWVRDAPSWPDASSWYWAAARPGSPVRTTLAVTVLE
ncbi:MAG: archaeosortase/exosortase family protein [Candidatus Hydrogenedentes bacterium]|nr:archaeosortase/exosortase family protein [Candidatus Hydrogenedentota bacterium]